MTRQTLAFLGNASSLTSFKRSARVIAAVKSKRPKLANFLEVCKEKAVEPSSELFSPAVKKRINKGAATIKSLNECLDITARGKSFFGEGPKREVWQQLGCPRSTEAIRSQTASINPSRSASGLRDLSSQRRTELPSWSKATGVSSCMGRVNRESLGLADRPGPQTGVYFFPSSSESAYYSLRQPLSRGER